MKKAITIRIDENILNRLRNLVYWSHGMTLNDFAERAIDYHLKDWERKFPEITKQRDSNLKVGRKIE